MDETSPPTAVELGISDVEYERIMRDLRQRGRIDEPPTPLTFSAPSGDRPTRRRLAVAVVLGLVAAVLVVGRLGASDPDPVYKFIETVDGRPVTYSSCRPIQVSVYPAGGPSDAEALVREAVDQMRSATGLDIVVAGAFGGYAPNWNFEDGPVYPDDPISISWQDGEAIARLTDDIAGLGGSRVLTGPRKRLVAGTVALSRDYYALLEERNDHSEALAVLLHELGHVFGLDHVDSPRELMYHDNNGQTGFGPGDLEGLRLLGQGPCS
jgi:hypothetical protein